MTTPGVSLLPLIDRCLEGLWLLAAFLIPLTTKRNLYCSHLCPHGALQQLVKKRLPWQAEVPKRLARALRLDKLEFLVLDEGDRMFDMGFIRDIRKVLALLPENHV